MCVLVLVQRYVWDSVKDFYRTIMRLFGWHTKLNETLGEDTFCDSGSDSWQLLDIHSSGAFPLHLVAFSPFSLVSGGSMYDAASRT